MDEQMKNELYGFYKSYKNCKIGNQNTELLPSKKM